MRAATSDDFDAVLALIAERNLADYGEALISADSLRQAWQTPGLELDRDTWLATRATGQVAAYGALQREGDDKFFLWLCVADSSIDREVAAQIRALAEARARTIAAGAARMMTRVAGRDAGMQQLVEDAGYRCTLSFQLMEIELRSAPPHPEWPEGIMVRSFTPDHDDQAAYRADEEASEDKGYHTPLSFDAWATRMSLYRDTFDPGLWFLACDGSEIAGVALNFQAPDGQTGWVDHLGVRRAWRRRGLGRALLLQSFGAFFERGIPRVRLSVDSGSLTNAPRLYERAGMRIVQQYHIYVRELP